MNVGMMRMKICGAALAALILSAASSEAQQPSPPPTPVLPCDSNSVTGARFVRPLLMPTRTNTPSTDVLRTSISLSNENGAMHYFVGDTETPLEGLGQAVADAWFVNSPGNSVDQCWTGSATGRYVIKDRDSTICRIVIRADESVTYGYLEAARYALRRAGFTQAALMSVDQNTVVFDDQLPLNPVPVRLEGIRPTLVRIMASPAGSEPIMGIANGRGWRAVPLSQFNEPLRREATRDNSAVAASEVNTRAAICIRPDRSIAYRDVLNVMTTVHGYGYVRVGLYSEAVVAISDQK